MQNEKIIQAIFRAVDDLNQQLPEEKRPEKSADAVLFGKAGKLDSLGLVNLIIAIEEQIQEEFGVAITLADERAVSQKNSPFKTIRALADYIGLLIEENGNG